jgi:hypothetical protein
MGRGPIIGPAIREIRKAFRMNLSFHRIRLPIPGDGDLPSFLSGKEKGQKRSIPLIAQDHIRIETSEKLLDFSDIDRLHLHTIPFTLQEERLLPKGVSIHSKFHDPKVRNAFIAYPHRLGWIRMNFKDSISFNLNKTSACWKNLFLIKIGLGQRNVTIVEGHFLFPWRENSGKLGIMLRIDNLDLDHFHFLATPELFLSGPLAACRPLASLEKAEEIEEIALFPLCIESGSERIFQSTKPPILLLDPEDHRGV